MVVPPTHSLRGQRFNCQHGGDLGVSNREPTVDWSTVVAVIGVGATLACGLLAACATLYAADKMPLAHFYASVVVSALLLTGFGALAFLLRKGWFGKGWHIPSNYLWSGFLLLIAISLPVTATFYGDLLVLELSVVPLIFMAYLLRCTLLRRVEDRQPWEYHFIKHLEDESTVRHEGPGSVVRVVRNAKSHTILPEAIFEHPPGTKNDTTIRFCVQGINQSVIKLKLQGSYGILEQFLDEDQQLKESRFHESIGNRVRFEVWVDELAILRDERADYGWVPIESKEPIRPHRGSLVVELRTNCVGDPSYNWAAWGELKLVEWN
jgi:hypothetical protein